MRNPVEIREIVFKYVFSTCFKNTIFDLESLEEDLSKKEIELIRKRVENIKENDEKIMQLIEKNLKKDWTICRLSKVDLAILKLAISELLYTDIPYKVTVNEAVELAKKYGSQHSSKFINGLLATVIKQEKIEGK